MAKASAVSGRSQSGDLNSHPREHMATVDHNSLQINSSHRPEWQKLKEQNSLKADHRCRLMINPFDWSKQGESHPAQPQVKQSDKLLPPNRSIGTIDNQTEEHTRCDLKSVCRNQSIPPQTREAKTAGGSQLTGE